MTVSPSTWLDYHLRRASVSHIFNPHYRPALTAVALVYLLAAARTFSILFGGAAAPVALGEDVAISTTQSTPLYTSGWSVSVTISLFVSILLIVSFVYVRVAQGLLTRRNARDQAKWACMGFAEGIQRLFRNTVSKPILVFLIASILAEVGNTTQSTPLTLFVLGVGVVAWRLKGTFK